MKFLFFPLAVTYGIIVTLRNYFYDYGLLKISKVKRPVISVGNITSTGNSIVLEGATADGNETTLTVTDPTGDRTITFPDATGTVVTTGDSNSVTGSMIAADTVAEANMANDAIGSAELKSLSTLLIKNSGGSTLKTIHGSGA